MNEWISCETEFPSADEIICLNKNTNEIFNMKLVESKGGGTNIGMKTVDYEILRIGSQCLSHTNKQIS